MIDQLGNIDFILADKTGTLTRNKMDLRGIIFARKVFGGIFTKKSNEQILDFKVNPS